ncbi:hypothetical protein RRG08_029516 [Elysia crispata]|uniref:Uncharacterized protein n=1 Tax=Elysia crispata TaxID=231223 RepID=A0AAE1CNB2_9GAST|nr:hypothetical protein RRG08_029516 [Elysia crispata]
MSRLIQPDDDIPVDAFLSGDKSGGLYRFRHQSTRANLWTRARHAASRLHSKIDASSDNPTITAEDVSSVPAKAVKSHWLEADAAPGLPTFHQSYQNARITMELYPQHTE